MSVPPHELASRNPGIRTAQRMNFMDSHSMCNTASHMPLYHHDIQNTSSGFIGGRSSSPPRSTASSFNPYAPPMTSSPYRGDSFPFTARTANPYVSSSNGPYTASNFSSSPRASPSMTRSSSPFRPTTSSPFRSSSPSRAMMTANYYNPSLPSSTRSMHSTASQFRSASPSPMTSSAYRPNTMSSVYGGAIRSTGSQMPQPIFQPKTATAYGQYWE